MATRSSCGASKRHKAWRPPHSAATSARRQGEETTMLSWRVGDVTVKRIVEMEMPIPPEWQFLAQATPEALRQSPWLYPHFVNDKDEMLISIHALLVETPG